ncbi:zinc finger HIT domain-containing protein 3 [Musca vetustissima]|uniref:zinc finger HIT domain-containing protein 3 n=1 Tax=Musca vetustissima TaxID=27455 RepID=UPI002AB77319|nr:zinc finger HIT domain-containing protein 3 [Musca vetustissima]
MECIVCHEVTNKYKCPKCFGQYCSLQCYKVHKDSPECVLKVNETESTKADAPDDEEEPTVHEPFKTEDTVPKDKLQMLGNSESLKNLLYNPHLRNLLTEIDTAPNAWKAIRAAMQEPLFLEFADECLQIVEPQNQED